VGSRRREYTPRYQARDGARRHCWVIRTATGVGPWPGLILEWQRRDDGWWARVIYIPYPVDTGTSVEAWLTADSVRPAGDAPTPPAADQPF